MVSLEGERGLLEEVRAAVRSPTFLLGLGRRDCPPSCPIFFSLSEDAPEVALEKAAAWIEIAREQIRQLHFQHNNQERR